MKCVSEADSELRVCEAQSILHFLLEVKPNSRRFDAWIAGARFDSQSHSRHIRGCYDRAILTIWGMLDV